MPMWIEPRLRTEGLRRAILRFGGIALAITLALAAALIGPRPASATAAVQICFAIDGSGSIDNTEFDLETGGIAAAIQDSNVLPHDGSVEVSAIAFAENVVTIVSPTVIDSTATATTVATAITGYVRSGLGTLTNPALAIDECAGIITGSAKFATAGTQVINMASNGQQTTGGNAVTARQNAVANGIDRLDVLAVQSPNLSLLLDMVWPQPGENVAVGGTPTGNTGFVLNVDSFDDFDDGIAVKIPAIIPPPPIGGISLDPNLGDPAFSTSDPSGTGIGLPLGVVATLAMSLAALGVGGWYAMRRRTR